MHVRLASLTFDSLLNLEPLYILYTVYAYCVQFVNDCEYFKLTSECILNKLFNTDL